MNPDLKTKKTKENHHSIADFAFEELAKNVIEFKSYLSRSRIVEFAERLINDSVEDQRKFLDNFFVSEKSIVYMYETFFPETSRLLGNQWSQDILSFGQVSVGIGNLQILLKHYDHLYVKHSNPYRNSPNILLVTPEKEAHTFGSLIAYRAFQKLGCNPFLLMSPSTSEIKNVLKVNSFDLIGVSLADFTLIEEVKSLVAIMRNIVPVNCPIILGGEIKNWSEDATRIPGLDAISSKPQEVLEMCELMPNSKISASNSGFINQI